MAKRSVRYSIFGALSLLLLIPCYWRSHIASSDLASHIYNAWLTIQIQEGRVAGIEIARQWNNVLFDLMLAGLLPLTGSDWSERIAVSVAVLVFAGGSMIFIVATSRGIPWHILPGLAMLAYGFVFHVGLFNYYLSTGFCLAALGLLWNFSTQRMLYAAPFVALGFLSHPLPVVWLAVVIAFISLARRVPVRNRLILTVVMFGAVLATAKLLTLVFKSRWQLSQFFLWSGVDQAVVYDSQYWWWGLAWFAWWTLLFGLMIHRLGWPRVFKSVLFHLIIVQAAVLVFIPSQIQFPGYPAPFSLFCERMSLIQGVLVCGLLARAPLNALALVPGLLLGASYFYQLYREDGLLAQFQDQVTAVTASFSGRPKAVTGLCIPDRRINYGSHLVDRACVGNCYSYGNYEPSSGHFRLRAHPSNGFVVAEISRAYAFEFGGAEVTAQDLPLLRIEGTLGGEITVRELREGEKVTDPCPVSQSR